MKGILLQHSKPESQNQLNYSDIEHIVEYLVRVKSKQHTFDCWDTEDIAQEIRIICFNAIAQFDFDRVKDERQMVNYFGRCVDNRLQNLKRDNYIRYDVGKSLDEEKINKTLDKIQRQKNIKHPINIEQAQNMPYKLDVECQVMANDMRDHLLNNIDDELKEPLEKIMDGAKKEVGVKTRKKIQSSVKEILED